MRYGWTPFMVMAMALAARSAHAEVDLRWEAPAGCPGQDEVQSRLRALVGSHLQPTEGLSAEGKIRRENGRFYLELVLRDGPNVRRRELSSDSCLALGGAAAVSLALLLGMDPGVAEPSADTRTGSTTEKKSPSRRGRPEGVREQESPASDSKAAVDEPAKPADSPDEAPKAAEKPAEPPPTITVEPQPLGPPAVKRRWAVVLRAPAVMANLGLLPTMTIGGGLGIGMRYESWRALMSAYLSANQNVGLPNQDGVGAKLRRTTGEIVVCRGWRSPRFEISPCLGLAVEHISARAFGDGVSPSGQQSTWLAPGASVVAYWYFTQLVALFASIGGNIETARPRLVIEGLGQVTKLGPAAAGAAAGLEWTF